ncbi:MAG: hypothetical protein HYU44_10040 [Betaproteobacteria bacterium]|nr:hypothetical protein [Betaproteobacteria bacterium]
MAVSKALSKSYTLRTTAGLDVLMTVLNAEISRENPEQLFVTAIALVIDLRTGEYLGSRLGRRQSVGMAASFARI